MSCMQASSKKSKLCVCVGGGGGGGGATRPKFLVISSSDEVALKKLSRFAIQKGLVGLARKPKQ